MSWPLSFATQAVVRLRAPLVDDPYGDDVYDWSAADELVIGSCTVQPVEAPEIVEGAARNSVGRRWFVAGPADADVVATDRIRWAGKVYDVDGEPLRYGTGVMDHAEFHLTLVEG